MPKILSLALLSAALLAGAACSKNAVREDTIVEASVRPAVPAATSVAPAIAGAAGDAAPAEPAATTQPPRGPVAPPTVYFGYDSFLLDEAARNAVEAFGNDWLQRAGRPPIAIEGHADERGTEEYNLVLGEKRASAVRTYLARLGVPDRSLRTLSYGEARPAARGAGEQAWARNRRAEVRVATDAVSAK